MLSLPSVVTHAQAKDCLGQLVGALQGGSGPVVVNAAPLQQFDSSALAVLLELRRMCLRANRAFCVEGLSPRLLNLATLYGIEGLLHCA